jgi:hypothetical protein
LRRTLITVNCMDLCVSMPSILHGIVVLFTHSRSVPDGPVPFPPGSPAYPVNPADDRGMALLSKRGVRGDMQE